MRFLRTHPAVFLASLIFVQVSLASSGPVSVKDFGALGNGTGDDGPAFQMAANAAAPNGLRIFVPAGTYNILRPIVISNRGTVFHGDGAFATLLRFLATAPNQTLFTFNPAGSSDYYGGGLENLGMTVLTAQPGTTAIKIVNASHISLQSVATWEWSDPTHTSVGLQLQGREFFLVDRCMFYADRPFVIQKNPVLFLDFDHSRVVQSAFVPASSQPGISVADGVYISNSDFENVNVSGGTYGIYWSDHTATLDSNNVSVRNLRWETSDNGNGWAIYFTRFGRSYINNLVLDSITERNNVATNGVYLRMVRGGGIKNSDLGYESEYSSKTAVDMGFSVTNFSMDSTNLLSGFVK